LKAKRIIKETGTVALCISIIPFLLLVSSAFAAENKAEELWEKMLPKFRTALKLKDKQDTLPDSAIFHDDKQSSQKEINELLVEGVKGALKEELRGLGLDVNSEQVDFLLSTIVGENVMQVIVAFNNVKALTTQLEQLMVQSGENIDLSMVLSATPAYRKCFAVERFFISPALRRNRCPSLTDALIKYHNDSRTE
jgi:hypothetical protein